MKQVSDFLKSIAIKIFTAMPFVAIGAWLALRYAKIKELSLFKKVLDLEQKAAHNENEKKVDESFKDKSSSDIIDHAISKGRESLERKGPGGSS